MSEEKKAHAKTARDFAVKNKDPSFTQGKSVDTGRSWKKYS